MWERPTDQRTDLGGLVLEMLTHPNVSIFRSTQEVMSLQGPDGYVRYDHPLPNVVFEKEHKLCHVFSIALQTEFTAIAKMHII